MKTKNKLYLVGIISLSIFVVALPTSAAILPFCTITGNCQMCDFVRLFVLLAQWGLSTIGGISLLFFIIGGMYLVAGGSNQERFSKGKEIIKSAIIGMLIVLSAWLIVNFSVTALSGSINGDGDGLIFEKQWYKVPVCANIGAASEDDVIQFRKCNKYSSELKKTDLSESARNKTLELFATEKCDDVFTKVYDGTDCEGVDIDGKDTSSNMVVWVDKTDPTKVLCVSKCDYLKKSYPASYKTHGCRNKTECKDGVFEAGFCSGGIDIVCCKPK